MITCSFYPIDLLLCFDYGRIMKEGPDISYIAALIGEPARSNMLTALMSGKALTVGEMAREAGVTVQTASSHLSKLHAGGLITPLKQGRHKYYSLANAEVAKVLEALMGLAAGSGHVRTRTGPKDARLRYARVCYNHLAGDMGTRMFDSMVSNGFLCVGATDITLSLEGRRFVMSIGVDVDVLERKRAPLCRECLDWSARRSHLAGSLGRALLMCFEEKTWAKRDPGSRVIEFTRHGRDAFDDLFPLPFAKPGI